MGKLVLIGGGGHCKSVLDAALRMNEFEEVVITDPEIEPGSQILGCSVVGDDTCLDQLRHDGIDYAFITVRSVRSSGRLRTAVAFRRSAVLTTAYTFCSFYT